jgi:hypothetical protein
LDRWLKGRTVGYITGYHSYNYDSVKESKNYMMVTSYICNIPQNQGKKDLQF